MVPSKLPGTYLAPHAILTIHTCSSIQHLNRQSQNKIEGKVFLYQAGDQQQLWYIVGKELFFF